MVFSIRFKLGLIYSTLVDLLLELLNSLLIRLIVDDNIAT